MQLTKLKLKNFRSFSGEHSIPFDEFTAFIGKNDAGKSSILEALEIFFNKTSKKVKIDVGDLCTTATEREIQITCIFEVDANAEIIFDVASPTSLEREFLLNSDGLLEIIKTYKIGKTVSGPTVSLNAFYPTVENASDLFRLKQAELRKRIRDLGLEDVDGLNQNSNASMRRAIFESFKDLGLANTLIGVDDHSEKTKLDKWVQSQLPIYALFQSDRSSTDGDTEVQNPLSLAVDLALKDQEAVLNQVADQIKQSLQEVADATIEKIKEMAPEIAEQIVPDFSKEPAWAKAFSFSLQDENSIPINKRGSGVRRLVLINFFRADAERRQREDGRQSVIYAIEEPETSQHPDHQSLLVEALLELSCTDTAQVAITTHVPGLAGLVPIERLRHVRDAMNEVRVSSCALEDKEEFLDQISRNLGVHPSHDVRVLFFVEGVHDIEFFVRMSRLLCQHDDAIIDMESSPHVALIPTGGETLKQWVERKYLRRLKLPEVHVYDLEDYDAPKYQEQCDEINANGGEAFLTRKLTLESYLHADAIQDVFGVTIAPDENTKIPEVVAKAVHQASESTTLWDDLDDTKKKKKIGRVKTRLNREVVEAMTLERLQLSDPDQDIMGWLRLISRKT